MTATCAPRSIVALLGLVAAPFALLAPVALAQNQPPPALPQPMPQAPQVQPAQAAPPSAPAMPMPALPKPAPPPAAAVKPVDPAEAMANEAFDGFRVHCLANLANPKLVKDGAKEMKYAPVEPDVVRRLGSDEAWYVPSDHGSMILGIGAKGNTCGIVVQTVDVAAFVKILEARLPLNLASDEVKSGLRARVYSLLYDNRTATLRMRHSADSSRMAPVSVSVSDSKPVQVPPVAAAPARPAPRPEGGPREQTAAAPVPQLGGPQPREARRPVQIAFPGKPALEAWDQDKKVLENQLTLSFSDACYNTRAQPTDMLTRAQQQKWKPLQAAMLGGGFDFAWTTPEAPPDQMLVFYDSLKPRCCVAAFGVHKLNLMTAAMKRFTLTPDKSFATGGKEVIHFTPRKDYYMSLDFEPADDGTTFANLCYNGRR
ncbi:MAG: hypothetical protein ACT4N4_07110 [Rhodospirillales bacterium]